MILYMKRIDPTGCILGLAGGLLCVIAVLLGAFFDVPKFCPRDGYLGVEFLGSFLYALGNDMVALCIVSAVWFVYLSVPFAAIGLGISWFHRRRELP